MFRQKYRNTEMTVEQREKLWLVSFLTTHFQNIVQVHKHTHHRTKTYLYHCSYILQITHVSNE